MEERYLSLVCFIVQRDLDLSQVRLGKHLVNEASSKPSCQMKRGVMVRKENVIAWVIISSYGV